MCRKGTKEHEAIVATDAEPKAIHAALLLTRRPRWVTRSSSPPSSSHPPVRQLSIEFLWQQDGEIRRSDAHAMGLG